MAIDLTFTTIDAYARQGKKGYEGVDTVMADAQTSAAALLADFNGLTLLGVVKESFTTDVLVFQSAQAGANLDAGATIRTRLNNGKLYSFKIPAPVAAVINSDGSIDVTNALVTDFIANFESAGKYRVSEGNYVVAILGGELDR